MKLRKGTDRPPRGALLALWERVHDERADHGKPAARRLPMIGPLIMDPLPEGKKRPAWRAVGPLPELHSIKLSLGRRTRYSRTQIELPPNHEISSTAPGRSAWPPPQPRGGRHAGRLAAMARTGSHG